MDHRLSLYFREIVYNNPSAKKGSVCGVFSYEALNVEEAKLGNLYLVGKISNIPRKQYKNYEFLLSVLTSVMKREFYSDPKKTTVEALESTLQSANIYLDDFAKKGHKEWIGNFHFACFAFSKNNIHIGQTGEILIYLFRKNSMSNIARKFSNGKQRPLKTFSNIASGNLEDDDKILVSALNVLEITPAVKIKELLSRPNTEPLFNYLKNNLKKTESLATLILEVKSEIPIIKKEVIKPQEISKPVKINLQLNIPKYFLIFFLFLIIVLSPYLIQKINYDLKLKKIDNLIKRTKEITFKSEVALAYQNQFDARNLLQQANVFITNADSILAKLPEIVKAKKISDIELVSQNLNIQENSINNVINIEQPQTIINLSQNTFSFNPHGILKLENTLYLYEQTSGFLYKIDLDDNYTPTLIFLSSKDTFKLGASLENAIVLLSSPDKVYVYGKSDNYNTYLLKPDLENTLYVKDVTQYSNNLYFLDIKKLSILKYVPGESSLTGEEWMNEAYKSELVDAESLAIDGSIFVSKTDGTIAEFVRGRKVRDFKPDIDPAINKGGQIFTKPDMKNIYFVDKQNQRIIAINKLDHFTTQYISPAFAAPTDIWITDDEKTMFVLDGLKVFKIDM